MKILITGICGFVGSSLSLYLRQAIEGVELFGVDNFVRPGSERNRPVLMENGIKIYHGDIRQTSDLETLPAVDWVIDAAANPSVLAGIDGLTSSRQLIEHNLLGTVNLLEFCKAKCAGFILLSTSRVYSINGLSQLKVEVSKNAFQPIVSQRFPVGISPLGVDETYTTQAPVSLYGATKVCSEALALEYGKTFGFPVLINRCGVLAGAGQFGRPDQGIFSYWVHSWKQKQPLRYIGFDGQGHQVRDCLHPDDLGELVYRQLAVAHDDKLPSIVNVSGGIRSAVSLHQVSEWCTNRFGPHRVQTDARNRAFDIPWMVLDVSLAEASWNWAPKKPTTVILEEIATHAEKNPDWLTVSAPY